MCWLQLPGCIDGCVTSLSAPSLTVPCWHIAVLLMLCKIVSLMCVMVLQGKSPALTALMKVMQARATKLLAHLDGGRSWGAPGRMPAGGQYCFESPQVAR